LFVNVISAILHSINIAEITLTNNQIFAKTVIPLAMCTVDTQNTMSA